MNTTTKKYLSPKYASNQVSHDQLSICTLTLKMICYAPFEIMFTDFYAQVDEYLTKSPAADPIIGEILFKQWSDNASLARLVAHEEIEPLLLNEFKLYVGRVIHRFNSVHQLPIQGSQLVPYVVDFIAGASFMVIMRWIKDDFPINAKEMGRLYANLVQPGLMQVLTSGRI